LKFYTRSSVCALLALFLTAHAQAERPIGFARSTNVMLDYREDTMSEAQIFYAPEQWFSFGLGYSELTTDISAKHSITYARLNLLAKRWNMESAQANIFGWVGVGSIYIGPYNVLVDGVPEGHNHGGTPDPTTGDVPAANVSTYNVGGQIDFETHRFYSSFSTDFFDSAVFWHRADTLQIGFSPYRHDANGLATWLIVSGRNYSGVYEKSELAFLLRLFKKRVWLEAGATTEGKIQALAMFNF
jgi:hypothetical protein